MSLTHKRTGTWNEMNHDETLAWEGEQGHAPDCLGSLCTECGCCVHCDDDCPCPAQGLCGDPDCGCSG